MLRLKHQRIGSIYLLCGLVAFISFLTSCRRSTEGYAVVVRVFRDHKSDFSRDLDRKIYGFNERHRVVSGKLIVVATIEGDYRTNLAEEIALNKPQMIILDAPADASQLGGMHFDLRKSKSACGKDRDCPAFIPPWVTGEELEASNLVFAAITKD